MLRQREDADAIECQAVLSGRWKPLSNPYWDDCVIAVPWRVRPESPAGGRVQIGWIGDVHSGTLTCECGWEQFCHTDMIESVEEQHRRRVHGEETHV